jgi:hypothetical protein
VSRWRVELDEVPADQVAGAVSAFLTAASVLVERLTKQGRRTFDARGPVVRLTLVEAPSGVGAARCAILDLVIRQVSPSVRPDDVLSGLRVVADLAPPAPPLVTRLAQGTLTAQGEFVDPLLADRDQAVTGAPSA